MLRNILLAALIIIIAPLSRAADPLPSWNDTAPKRAILAFVNEVTKEGSVFFVKPEDRIATFDNDGTLWCEQPLYVQGVFAIDRVKQLAPEHPKWKDQEPFKSILAGNIKEALAGGDHAILELIMATHSGMTVEHFETIVTDWLAAAKHPRFKQPYTKCIYVPMVELAAYLRANGFKTYIVSGGGVEFMRPWTETAYGIPPEQVIGSRGKTKFEMHDSGPELHKLPAVDFVDDGPGKPVGINQQIGRRPVIAVGNSDGDLEMLQWTTMVDWPTLSGGLRLRRDPPPNRLGLIVHHTDAVREYAYDRDSHIGKLDKALDAAPKQGWTVVSMKDDWNRIFPFDSAEPNK
ncbi:MAG: haloacid dehalogenase-like hydrolase [Phycisphaerales bacterium]|nr:haloacid dehalogenase-like hydrolase [Phycisphaerales bacterium]